MSWLREGRPAGKTGAFAYVMRSAVFGSRICRIFSGLG